MSDEHTRLLFPMPRPNHGSRRSGTPWWQVFQQSDEDVYHENDSDNGNGNDNDSDNGSHRDDQSSGGGRVHRSQPERKPKQQQQVQQKQQQLQHQQQPVQYPKRPTNHHRDSMITMGPIVGVSKPIKKWYRGLIVRQSCHNRLASDFLARDAHLSTLSVVLTALTSSAIFVSLTPLASATGDELATELEASTSTISSNSSISISTAGASAWSQILAVLAGTIAACNTVLQGITRTLYYGQRGERHLRAYREYSVLRFQLESIVGDKPLYAEHKVDRTRLEAWIRSYEEVLEESPTIPQQVFDRVASEQDRKGLSWTKDDREVRAIIDEERKLAAIRESKLMSSYPSLFSP